MQAIQRQPKDYSGSLWDNIADWFCGTQKAVALEKLAETCDGSMSFTERAVAFSDLKALTADLYQDRFHTTLHDKGMTLSIIGNDGGNLVETTLTSTDWQQAWNDTLNETLTTTGRHVAFYTLQNLAGKACQDKFQITLSHKGLQFTITDQRHSSVLQAILNRQSAPDGAVLQAGYVLANKV